MPGLSGSIPGCSRFEQTGDNERLYVVAGSALDLLNPDGPAKERLVIARTLARRAKAAHDIGRNDEAVELYGQAIARYKAEDRALTSRDRDLVEATTDLMVLQTELGNVKESLSATAQVLATAPLFPRLVISRLFGSKRRDRDGKPQHSTKGSR